MSSAITSSTSFGTPIATVTTATSISNMASRTSTGSSVTTSSTSYASSSYPALSPTTYSLGGPAIPSPSASCLPRFKNYNVTLLINANTVSAENMSPAFSSAFTKCCAPQSVNVYDDTCLLVCPFFGKPGETLNQASDRFGNCLKGFGQDANFGSGIHTISAGGTPLGAIQTATGSGMAAQTSVAKAVAALPLLAGVLGAVMM